MTASARPASHASSPLPAIVLGRWSSFLASSADVSAVMESTASLAEHLDQIEQLSAAGDARATELAVESYNRSVVDLAAQIDTALRLNTAARRATSAAR